MTTGEFHGTPAPTRSRTRRTGYGGWYDRKVRADGTVLVRGVAFRPIPDTQTAPEPGEWLTFYDYPSDVERRHLYEWSAPADADGVIRRWTWMVAEQEERP